MAHKIPSRKQAREVVRRVTKMMHVRCIDSTKWYNFFARRAGKKMLKKIGVRDVGRALATRFIFQGASRGGVLLCPRPLGDTVSSVGRAHDMAVLSHEMCHRNQSDRDGYFHFSAWYMGYPGRRAFFEMESECAGADVLHFLGVKPATGAEIFDREWREMYVVTRENARNMGKFYDDEVEGKHGSGRYCEVSGGLVCKVIREVMDGR